jgi:hypothetical protein
VGEQDEQMKTFADGSYSSTTTLRHQGVVLSFSATADGAAIVYSTLDLQRLQSTSQRANDDDAWTELQTVDFPTQVRPAGMNVLAVDATAIPADKPLSPVNQGFQVHSDGDHVHVFRRSTYGTLYVDRFVFVPGSSALQPAWETRYQRSRTKDVPASSKDSVSFKDMDGEVFREPTTELTFVQLDGGGFAVFSLPTDVPGQATWYIVTASAADSGPTWYAVPRSPDGLFDVAGGRISRTSPGLGSGPEDPASLRVAGLPTALVYAQQELLTDQYGRQQRARRATRVMLACPVTVPRGGTCLAVLDLPVTRDGQLPGPDLPALRLPPMDRASGGGELLVLPVVERTNPWAVIRGGILRVDDGPSDPFLLDGADGLVHLYFRSHDNRLSAVQYDTTSARADYVLPLESGRLVFTGATAGSHLNSGVSIAVVDGSDADRCDVSISTSGTEGSPTETWHDVPRDLTGFVQVLSGTAAPGTYDVDLATSVAPVAHPATACGPDGEPSEDLWTAGPDDAPETAAIAFGRRGHVAVQDVGLSVGAGPHTVEAWISLAARPAQPTDILRLGESEVWQVQPDGTLLCGPSTGRARVSTHTPLTPGVWVHIASTYDGSVYTVYVDGAAPGPGATTPLESTRAPLVVGQPGAGPDELLDGAVRDLRVWALARAGGQISDARVRELTGQEPGLVGWWPMTEGEGAALPDHVRASHDLTRGSWLFGVAAEAVPPEKVPGARVPNALLTTPDPARLGVDGVWRTSTASDALAFDGTAAYVTAEVPDPATFDETAHAWTVETWSKLDGPLPDLSATLLEYRSPGAQVRLGVQATRTAFRLSGAGELLTTAGALARADAFDATGYTVEAWFRYEGGGSLLRFGAPEFRVYCSADRNQLTSQESPGSVFLYTGLRPGWPQAIELRRGWNHLAVSVSPVQTQDTTRNLHANVYANGELCASSVIEDLWRDPMARDWPLAIGAPMYGDWFSADAHLDGTAFQGPVTEVRVWSEPRSQVQVRAHMSTTLRGDEPALFAYYPFAEGRGNAITSAAGPGIRPALVLAAGDVDDFAPAVPLDSRATQTTGGRLAGDMDYAVTSGSPRMQLFASAMGLTSEQLTQLHDQDPAQAFTEFVHADRWVNVSNAIVAEASGSRVVATGMLREAAWSHVAATYTAGHALRLGGGDSVDCGPAATLNPGDALTVEAWVAPDDVGTAAGPVVGQWGDSLRDSSFVLGVDRSGRPYADVAVGPDPTRLSASAGAALAPGEWSHLAASYTAEPVYTGREVRSRCTLTLYVNGVPAPTTRVELSTSGTLNAPRVDLRMGVAGSAGDSARPTGYTGRLQDVRIWTRAVGPTQLAQISADPKDIGDRRGLAGWWPFDEGSGRVAQDRVGTSTATISSGRLWELSPLGAAWQVYLDGLPVTGKVSRSRTAATAGRQLTLGASLADPEASAPGPHRLFRGQLDEIRLWRTARTQQQVNDVRYRPLTGHEDGLTAYWPVDAATDAATDTLQDRTGRGSTGTVHGARVVDSDAPLGEEGPEVRSALARLPGPGVPVTGALAAVEYGDIETTATKALSGVMRRCYAFLTDGALHLVTGFEVGELLVQFIGQVQTAPTLIGYIEGAPPVPSENLTVPGATYDGTGSVALSEMDSTVRSFTASRNAGSDLSADLKVGIWISEESSAGLGVVQKVFAVDSRAMFHSRWDVSHGWLDDASVSLGTNRTLTSSLRLRGGWEKPEDLAFPDLPPRWLPNNHGYALVKSRTADLYALQLKNSRVTVSYQVLPDPNIPEDWNIISFPIARDYIKNGTLDGRVGLHRDPDYAGLGDGEPGSYFKPHEAYQLKDRIEKDEAALRSFYEQYNVGAGRADVRTAAAVQAATEYDSARRSLVNTYVWTADGGLYTEEEQTTAVQDQSEGGSFHFLEQYGGFVDLKIKAGLAVEADVLTGGHIDVTVSKRASSSASFGLGVTVAGESDLDGEDGEPVPGKVDAYRFMTFYLAPASEHRDTFFDRVVDLEWLRGASTDAMALRAAQASPNKVWRVLHRVTYVSRIPPPPGEEPSDPVPPPPPVRSDGRGNEVLIALIDEQLRDGPQTLADVATALDAVLHGASTGAAVGAWWAGFVERAQPAPPGADHAAASGDTPEQIAFNRMRRDALAYLGRYFGLTEQ